MDVSHSCTTEKSKLYIVKAGNRHILSYEDEKDLVITYLCDCGHTLQMFNLRSLINE